jgi:hypothetical protein
MHKNKRNFILLLEVWETKITAISFLDEMP